MARKRRLRTLLALWTAYWAGLAAVEAGPVLWEYLRLQATAGHGSVTWSFSGSLTMLSLALIGPPLVLWALWLLVPEREDGRREGRERAPDHEPGLDREPGLDAAARTRELPEGAPFPGEVPERDARVRLPIHEEPPRP